MNGTDICKSGVSKVAQPWFSHFRISTYSNCLYSMLQHRLYLNLYDDRMLGMYDSSTLLEESLD